MTGRERARKPPTFSDRGIVLRTYRLGESDKIVRVLTREYGKRSAVAKGARKTTSRFGARLEPLTCVRILAHSGRNMDTLRQVEIETSFKEIREDLELFAMGSSMAELVDCITQEHDPAPELFDLMLKTLMLLKENPRGAAFILALFEFRVLSLAGFELLVSRCAGCGGEPGEGEMSFSLHLGGAVCEGCRAGCGSDVGKTIRISAESAGLLAWMAGSEALVLPGGSLRPATGGELRLFMDRVLEHWMEREFKSRRVIRAIGSGRYGERGGG